MRPLLPFILLAAGSQVQAAPDYHYCEIAGLAFGADKEFIGSIASRIANRQGIILDAGCRAVWKDSFETGKRLSAGGTWSDLDNVKWQKLAAFEAKIIDRLIDDLAPAN